MPLPFLRRASYPTPDLEPGERVLARATTTDGGHVVATDRALYVPVRDGRSWESEPWWRVRSATWDGAGSRLLVTAYSGDGPRVLRLDLDAEGMLPETVRERVQSSIVVSQYVRLMGRGGVRFTARRVPGEDELIWISELDPGLDADDPQVRALAAAALAELRAQTTA